MMLMPPHSGLCLSRRMNFSQSARGVVAFVVEADAPDGDEGFVVEVKVGVVVGVGAELHVAAEVFPVAGEAFEVVGFEAGEVEHEGTRRDCV